MLLANKKNKIEWKIKISIYLGQPIFNIVDFVLIPILWFICSAGSTNINLHTLDTVYQQGLTNPKNYPNFTLKQEVKTKVNSLKSVA